MSALQTAGVIEVKHGSGIYVRNVNEKMTNPLTLKMLTNRENILQILELRKALETEGAFLAAERANENDIAQIKDSLIALSEVIERGGSASAADRRFHCALIAAAHNPAYTNVYDTIANIFNEGMQSSHEYFSAQPELKLQVLEEHRLIYDAVKKHQPQQAGHFMRQHLENAENILRKLTVSD